MIGSFFAREPDILIHSFTKMNDQYSKTPLGAGGHMRVFMSVFVALFGIPEIGFQVRSMYFLNAVRVMFRGASPARILDAGSGIGSYVFTLARMYPGASVDGWEIDKTKLGFAKRFAKTLGIRNASFAYGDITKPPKIRGAYDLLINIDVLEHIDNYKAALSNMQTLLRPGGYLYLHTPAVNQKRFFRSMETWEHEDHVREGFEPSVLRKDLARAGFTDIRIRYSFGPFGSLAWEMHHILLAKSVILAGIWYPVLFMLSRLDMVRDNGNGLCLSITARKKGGKT